MADHEWKPEPRLLQGEQISSMIKEEKIENVVRILLDQGKWVLFIRPPGSKVLERVTFEEADEKRLLIHEDISPGMPGWALVKTGCRRWVVEFHLDSIDRILGEFWKKA